MPIPRFLKEDQMVKKLKWGTCRKEYGIISNSKCTLELNTRRCRFSPRQRARQRTAFVLYTEHLSYNIT